MARYTAMAEIDRASDPVCCWLLEHSGAASSVVAVSMDKSATLLIVLLGILAIKPMYCSIRRRQRPQSKHS
ncbi:hypothetical protein M8494_20195 [Serratia ureilytica]